MSCLLYKRWSDAEATRLFYFFEKSSREWPLLNNITRNGAGSLFADVTFGGYIIICVALYIAYLMGELKNSKKTVSPPPDRVHQNILIHVFLNGELIGVKTLKIHLKITKTAV